MFFVFFGWVLLVIQGQFWWVIQAYGAAWAPGSVLGIRFWARCLGCSRPILIWEIWRNMEKYGEIWKNHSNHPVNFDDFSGIPYFQTFRNLVLDGMIWGLGSETLTQHIPTEIGWCPAVSLTSQTIPGVFKIVWEGGQLNRDFKLAAFYSRPEIGPRALPIAGGPILCSQIWHGGFLPLGQEKVWHRVCRVARNCWKLTWSIFPELQVLQPPREFVPLPSLSCTLRFDCSLVWTHPFASGTFFVGFAIFEPFTELCCWFWFCPTQISQNQEPIHIHSQEIPQQMGI